MEKIPITIIGHKPVDIEETILNVIVAENLGMIENEYDYTVDCLIDDLNKDFSLTPDGIWGNNIDLIEFEEGLVIKTERELGFYTSK